MAIRRTAVAFPCTLDWFWFAGGPASGCALALTDRSKILDRFVAGTLACDVDPLLIRFVHQLRSARKLNGLAWLVPLALVALIAFVPVFNSCTKEMYRYDLGLYYLKTIRWTKVFRSCRVWQMFRTTSALIKARFFQLPCSTPCCRIGGDSSSLVASCRGWGSHSHSSPFCGWRSRACVMKSR